MNFRKVECLAMWMGIVAFIIIVSSIMIGASQEQRATARRIKLVCFCHPLFVLGTCSLAPIGNSLLANTQEIESENELREVGLLHLMSVVAESAWLLAILISPRYILALSMILSSVIQQSPTLHHDTNSALLLKTATLVRYITQYKSKIITIVMRTKRVVWSLHIHIMVDYANDEIVRRTAISRSGTAFDAPVRDAYGYNARSEVTSARRALASNPNQGIRSMREQRRTDVIKAQRKLQEVARQ